MANVKQGNSSDRPNITTGRALASSAKSSAESIGSLHRYGTGRQQSS
jgi:hypothetical protein